MSDASAKSTATPAGAPRAAEAGTSVERAAAESGEERANSIRESAQIPALGVAAELDRTGSPEMRYQSGYVWLIFFSSLDIMLTWAILRRDGEEVNPIAKQIIAMWGLHGAIVFKFALMLFVIVSCEVIGRRSDRAGRRLVMTAVGISAFPVVYSLALLVDHILLRPT
jgi:hypothetical protein